MTLFLGAWCWSLATSFGGADESGLRVLLTPRVTVSQPFLVLGDVARLEGGGASASALLGLDLGESPGPGQIRHLTPSGIVLSARLAGHSLGLEQIGGANEVEVSTFYGSVDARRVLEEAERFLKQNPGPSGDQLLIERRRFPNQLAVFPEAGEVGFEVEWHGRPADRGPAQVRVYATQQGRRVDDAVVHLNLRRFGPLLRLERPLLRGEEVREEDLLLVEGEVTGQRGDRLTEVAELDGQVASRALAAGHVLVKEDLQAPVLVERGDPVVMVLRQGALEITLTGTAERQGRRGEQVPVLNPSTRRSIRVELVGKTLTGTAMGRVR